MAGSGPKNAHRPTEARTSAQISPPGYHWRGQTTAMAWRVAAGWGSQESDPTTAMVWMWVLGWGEPGVGSDDCGARG